MIRFQCPKCQAALSAPPDAGGAAMRCRQCRQPLRVPPGSPAQAAAPINIRVEQPDIELPDPPSQGPNVAAALLWMVVFVASSLLTAFCGWIGVKMLIVGIEAESGRALAVMGTTSMPVWFMAVASAYIAARAFDRMTQH